MRAASFQKGKVTRKKRPDKGQIPGLLSHGGRQEGVDHEKQVEDPHQLPNPHSDQKKKKPPTRSIVEKDTVKIRKFIPRGSIRAPMPSGNEKLLSSFCEGASPGTKGMVQ